MSLIVMKRYENKVELAGDGLSAYPSGLIEKEDAKKVWQTSNLLFGMAGSRMNSDYVSYSILKKEKEISDIMTSNYLGLIKLFSDMRKEAIDQFKSIDIDMILINKHKQYRVMMDDEELYVSEIMENLFAVGSDPSTVMGMDYLTAENIIKKYSKMNVFVNDKITVGEISTNTNTLET